LVGDEKDAQKELKRLRKEIEREKRRAKEVVNKLTPTELVDALLPTTLTTRR
jgi:hypothetical protein